MSKFASFLGGNVVVVSGAAAAAVVAVVVVATGVFRSPDPQPAPPETTPIVAAPEQSEPVAVGPASTEETVAGDADTSPEALASEETAETPAAEPETIAVAPMIAPKFDLVRVEPDGRTLVAGNAAPNVEIAIILDQEEVAVATTDSSGKFVSFLNIAPLDRSRVMSLLQKGEGGVASEATVIIAAAPVVVAENTQEPSDSDVASSSQEPSSTTLEPSQPVVASTTPESSQPSNTSAEETGASGVDQEATQTADQDTTEAQAVPASASASVTTTVLLKDASGVTVMQSANEVGPDVMSTVALDAISYSEAGEVQLSGRSGQEGYVRVYLDNAPITTSRIEDDGNWRMELPDVDSGIYTLRVDEVSNDGTVVSRVETPFKREDQETLDAATQQASVAEAVTVQPGSTLWAIADERYGSGVMYVRVFEANRERIRNPDLIYPGQIFNLPNN